VARALGNLSLPLEEIIQTLKKMTADKEWEVQAQAFKSLGKLRCREALDVLSRGLFSPHWHCRLNAAWALANLGIVGLERLKKISRQKEDNYAADMANMVLNTMIITRT
ncbi:MAG: HEAT repeat domain-containing protein, partial [Acidobacteriota bacterium]